MVLTRQQRIALKAIYDRQPIYHPTTSNRMSYREFRRTVHNGFDCIMVPWCGMWLGIESDGYTHS